MFSMPLFLFYFSASAAVFLVVVLVCTLPVDEPLRLVGIHLDDLLLLSLRKDAPQDKVGEQRDEQREHARNEHIDGERGAVHEGEDGVDEGHHDEHDLLRARPLTVHRLVLIRLFLRAHHDELREHHEPDGDEDEPEIAVRLLLLGGEPRREVVVVLFAEDVLQRLARPVRKGDVDVAEVLLEGGVVLRDGVVVGDVGIPHVLHPQEVGAVCFIPRLCRRGAQPLHIGKAGGRGVLRLRDGLICLRVARLKHGKQPLGVDDVLLARRRLLEIVAVEDVFFLLYGGDGEIISNRPLRTQRIGAALLGERLSRFELLFCLVSFAVLSRQGDGAVRPHDDGVGVVLYDGIVKSLFPVLQNGGVVVLRHIHEEVEVGVSRIGVERLERDDDDDEGDDHGKAGAEHGIAVLLVQLHHLLVVHSLVVCILLLQLIQIVAHLAHDECLFSRLDALIDVEGEGDRL